MRPFVFLELQMDAAQIQREKREAEEKAKADAIIATAELQHRVDQLSKAEARQREKIATLEAVVESLQVRKATPRRVVRVSAPVRYCPLNAALERDDYE